MASEQHLDARDPSDLVGTELIAVLGEHDGIRRGTLPKLLGLENGDMITEINGQSLTSIDKVMSKYTKLRRASRLEVEIVRRGKSMTKEIQIH